MSNLTQKTFKADIIDTKSITLNGVSLDSYSIMTETDSKEVRNILGDIQIKVTPDMLDSSGNFKVKQLPGMDTNFFFYKPTIEHKVVGTPPTLDFYILANYGKHTMNFSSELTSDVYVPAVYEYSYNSSYSVSNTYNVYPGYTTTTTSTFFSSSVTRKRKVVLTHRSYSGNYSSYATVNGTGGGTISYTGGGTTSKTFYVTDDNFTVTYRHSKFDSTTVTLYDSTAYLITPAYTIPGIKEFKIDTPLELLETDRKEFNINTNGIDFETLTLDVWIG